MVDADGIFYRLLRKTSQETLLIPVHAVSGGNHKAIINEGFHRYFNKVQKISSADKGSLHQWLQGILFALYALNAGLVYITEITQSFVAMVRKLPFPTGLSPARLREGTS